MNQPPRMQLGGVAEYHDLAAFQAFTLMQTHVALAAKDQQIADLGRQLGDAKARIAALESATSEAY